MGSKSEGVGYVSPTVEGICPIPLEKVSVNAPSCLSLLLAFGFKADLAMHILQQSNYHDKICKIIYGRNELRNINVCKSSFLNAPQMYKRPNLTEAGCHPLFVMKVVCSSGLYYAEKAVVILPA